MCLHNMSEEKQLTRGKVVYKFVLQDSEKTELSEGRFFLPIIGSDVGGRRTQVWPISRPLINTTKRPLLLSDCYNVPAQGWPWFGYGVFEEPTLAALWGTATMRDQEVWNSRHGFRGVVVPIWLSRGTSYRTGHTELVRKYLKAMIVNKIKPYKREEPRSLDSFRLDA